MAGQDDPAVAATAPAPGPSALTTPTLIHRLSGTPSPSLRVRTCP
ncbi:hypothetical protein [Lentzea atacamensis]|nr:hypothetical protein [Lentzea atacamensis]